MKRKAMKYTSSMNSDTSVWSIEEIIEGPKYEVVNGKKKKYYKVRWSESFELASNIPADLIEIFEQRGKKQIKILGPLVSNINNSSDINGKTEEISETQPIQNMPLTTSKFAVEIGDEIILLSYSEVKSLYKNELLEYFEERARIERETS